MIHQGGIWKCVAVFFGFGLYIFGYNLRVRGAMVFNWWRSRMPNILQCVGQSLTFKSCPDQNTIITPHWKLVFNVTNDFYVPISTEHFSVFLLLDLRIFDIDSYSLCISLLCWLLWCTFFVFILPLTTLLIPFYRPIFLHYQMLKFFKISPLEMMSTKMANRELQGHIPPHK